MKNPWKRYSKINPQREDGNLQLNNNVIEALLSGNFTASEYKIILFIIRKTYGYNKLSDSISISQFKQAVNLSGRMIRLTTKNLKERRVVHYEPSKIRVKQGSPINEYLFNKHYDTWIPRRVKCVSGLKSNVEKPEIECHERVKHSSATIDSSTKDNSTKEKNTSSQIQRVNPVSPLENQTENDIPLKLSKKLFSLMLKNNPKARKPNFEKWAEHIEKLIRLDKRTTEEIAHVIQWSQQDDFWKANILSTQKLRKQFDQLWLKSNKSTKANERFMKNLQVLEDFVHG